MAAPACESFKTCATCAHQEPPAGIDFGIRCVWCPGQQRCRNYTRHTFSFPCKDALRKASGFPGGDQCDHPLPTPKALGRPRQEWGAAFEYEPKAKEAPVSIIIPSFARPSNLPFALAWLLQLEPLRRPGSEVLVSHGSATSFAAVPTIDSELARLCALGPKPGCARAAASTLDNEPPAALAFPVRHLDSTRLNAEVFAAQRYFAAANASNDVLLHLDDDLVPTEPMLQALIDRVDLEAAVPNGAAVDGDATAGETAEAAAAAAATAAQGAGARVMPVAAAPGLYGPSGLGRFCGAQGYRTQPQWPSEQVAGTVAGFFLPSGLTMTSAAANRRYLSRFDADFRALLAATRGNGEDLTYAYAIWERGGAAEEVGGCAGHRAMEKPQPRQWRDVCAILEGEVAHVRGAPDEEANAKSRHSATAQYHTKKGHYEARQAICRCLITGGGRQWRGGASRGPWLQACVLGELHAPAAMHAPAEEGKEEL